MEPTFYQPAHQPTTIFHFFGPYYRVPSVGSQQDQRFSCTGTTRATSFNTG